MNIIYIDFDSTLYDTPKLATKMLNVIAYEIHLVTGKKLKEAFEECKSMFNRENIYDIYELNEHFAKKYGLNKVLTEALINQAIGNGKDLVFPDVENFLKKLKENNHKLILLTFSAGSIEFQNKKINGSGLREYLDDVIVTKTPKYEMNDVDYQNGIFIDDNPEDLSGLIKAGAKKVIRIRREENKKYSKKDMNKEDMNDVKILECENFDELLDKYFGQSSGIARKPDYDEGKPDCDEGEPDCNDVTK